MFPHPGWAILLHLFVAASEGHELDGDALSAAAGVPRPVALPHLARLVSAKLVRRQPHHHRPDATYLTLTPAGERALHEYLGRAPTNMDAAAA
jgi:DNA-binding MarR family transcriptional regulator